MHQISISAGDPLQTPLAELTDPASKGREGSGREKGRGVKGRGEGGLEPPPLQISRIRHCFTVIRQAAPSL